MTGYTNQDMAAELIAGLANLEPDGTDFHTSDVDRNGGFAEFDVVAVGPDGSEHHYVIHVSKR